MLRIKNLTKTYKSKDGESCTAVNDVSIDFGGSGLVFIVGKSGSGKSTLLNLLSGLDKCDGGDIIIAGKSSAEFTQSDFDIYRNTYVGFIFQDFSLMDELTVGENIVISAKLQGKAVTDNELDIVLKQVDLAGKQNRKIRELSGGQKQRVAIARALIKNPKIVFADEPTGSLDADTGKCVFELLRKLSRDRLVVVVSHDKDSAITYGDRIIEMRDGKIVGDRTKTHDVDLTTLRQEYENKINKNFQTTKVAKNKSEQEFMRTATRLPLREAVKIGVTNFKQKWISFTITTLLTVFALTGFALTFILNSYDFIDAQNLTYDDLNINTAVVVNTREKTAEEKLNTTATNLQTFDDNTRMAAVFTDERLTQITDEFGGVHRVYRFDGRDFAIPGMQSASINKITSLTEFAPTDNLDNFYHGKMLSGTMPNANPNAVEIVISDYTAESIMNNGGIFSGNEIVYPNTGYENILGKEIDFNGIVFEIVGIFSTDYRAVLYSDGKPKPDQDFMGRFNLENIYQTAIIKTDALPAYLNDSDMFFAELVFVHDDAVHGRQAAVKGVTNLQSALTQYGLTADSMFIKFADGYDESTNLDGDELVLSFSAWRELTGRYEITFAELTDGDFGDLIYDICAYTKENPAALTNAKIVGVFNDQIQGLPEPLENVLLMNQSAKEDLVSGSLIVAQLFVELPADRKEMKNVLSFLYDNHYEVLTYATTELKTIQTLFSLAADILTYISIALCIFVLIFLYNFIVNSIGNKTKEIGILRSLGARGGDIAKIFGFEGLIIAAANIFFSFVLILIGVPLFNNAITSKFPTHITIISVTPLSVILTILLCAGITAISCLLPLLRLTKMRPAEVIRRAE